MTVYAAIGIVGRLAVAGTVDYVGRRPLLVILGAGGTISLWMLGQQTTLSGLQFWGWSCRLLPEGMTGLLAALTPELFPTRFRATGIGWAQGVGRVGGILRSVGGRRRRRLKRGLYFYNVRSCLRRDHYRRLAVPDRNQGAIARGHVSGYFRRFERPDLKGDASNQAKDEAADQIIRCRSKADKPSYQRNPSGRRSAIK